MDKDTKDKSAPRPRTKAVRYGKILLISSIVFAVMVAGIVLGIFTATMNTKPGLAADIRPPASSQIYDMNGNLIANIHAVENRVPVTLNKIPKNLQNAFIAVEDARFYDHCGVDPRGILRALWSNITNRGVAEGGSTITQQLAKNAYLTQERTLERKFQEIFLALQLERQYTKNEILELYLNQIYFGQGAYGVQAAAQLYFNKSVEDLTLSECALLAGIPKSPNYYSPMNNLKAAKERQEIVIDQMVKYGFLSKSNAVSTKMEEIKIAKHPSEEGSTFASYFIDYITQILIDKYGADAVYKDGLKVYTSLDTTMQKAAESSLINQLPVYRTDENGIIQPQGALIAIEPRTGYIKAMVGGRGNDQFNRATMAVRQPGSAFKPFVFLAAIESGLSTATVIDDSPVTFGSWSPVNYNGKFNGKVTLRQTAERSLNVPTVKITQQIGPDKPLYYAQQMGISTLVLDGPQNDRNLSMALGGLTRGVTPLELASAYGVFANNGLYTTPTGIIKIIDRNGKTLEQTTVQEKSVISEKSAYTITDLLRGVIQRGTGTGANIGREAAGKSGTTSDYKDAWFVGYTPDLVAAVWMGNDSGGALDGITGGDLPATIWKTFMQQALASTPAKAFIKPPGVVIDNTPSILDVDKEKEKATKQTEEKTKKQDANKKAPEKNTKEQQVKDDNTPPQQIPPVKEPVPQETPVPPPPSTTESGAVTTLPPVPNKGSR